MSALQAIRRAGPVPGMLNQGEVQRLDTRDLLSAARASILRSGHEVIYEDRTRVWGRTTDGGLFVAIAHAARCQIDAAIRAVLQEAAACTQDLERVVVMPAMPSFKRSAARIDPGERAELCIAWLLVAGDGSVEYHAPPEVSLPHDGDEAEEPPPPAAFPIGLASQLRSIAEKVEALETRTPVHVALRRLAHSS